MKAIVVFTSGIAGDQVEEESTNEAFMRIY